MAALVKIRSRSPMSRSIARPSSARGTGRVAGGASAGRMLPAAGLSPVGPDARRNAGRLRPAGARPVGLVHAVGPCGGGLQNAEGDLELRPIHHQVERGWRRTSSWPSWVTA